MEPTLQQWMCMRDPNSNPTRIRADGSTRRTSPYRVELLPGDDHPYQDFIDLEEETPFTALRLQYQEREQILWPLKMLRIQQ
eukprot:1090689-Prorocentrum_lima.AAC.1